MGPQRGALRSRREVRDPLGSEAGTLGERDALARALGDPLKEVSLRCSSRAGAQHHRVLARKDFVALLKASVTERGLGRLASRQPRVCIQ